MKPILHVNYSRHVWLFFRVYRVQQRLQDLQSRLDRELAQRVASRTFLQEQTTVTTTTEQISESRLLQNNDAFRRLQDTLNKIQAMQVPELLNYIIVFHKFLMIKASI